MGNTIINTIITFIVSSALGYSLNVIKNYRQKLKDKETNENIQNVALQTLLKNQLTNIYFTYNEIEKIPDYIYKNFLDMLNVYEKLGGNDYIHTIAKKMEKWTIVKTDILK